MNSPEVSPSGKYMLFSKQIKKKDVLIIFNLETFRKKTLKSKLDMFSYPKWLQENDLFYISIKDKSYLVNPETQNMKLIFNKKSHPDVDVVSVSNDAKYLICNKGNDKYGYLYSYNVKEKKLRLLVKEKTGDFSNPLIDNQNKYVYYHYYNYEERWSELCRIELKNKKKTIIWKRENPRGMLSESEIFFFEPNNKYLYFIAAEDVLDRKKISGIYKYNLSTQKVSLAAKGNYANMMLDYDPINNSVVWYSQNKRKFFSKELK